jgi:hypothetical protein
MANEIFTMILFIFSYSLVLYVGIDIGETKERYRQTLQKLNQLKEEIDQIEKAFREIKEKQV